MNRDLSFTNPFKREVLRKALHLPAFAFPAMALYAPKFALVSLALLMAFYAFLMFGESRYPHKLSRVSQFVSFFKREEGVDPAPLYLALGLFLCLLFSTPKATFFAAYVIAICDSAAALVGMRLGRHKVFSLSKSWEGTLAFAILCFVGACFFLSPLSALLTALILALVELLGIKGSDNFLLPIISQFCLLLL